MKVTTRRTSVRGWIDTCHDLGRVKKWLLQMPPLLPSFGKRSGTLPRGFQVPGVSNVDRRAEWNENFLDLNLRCSLQILSCSGVRSDTVWQGLKWASHPVLRRSNYYFSCNNVFEVGAAHLQWQRWESKRLLWMWTLFEEGMLYLYDGSCPFSCDICWIPSGVVLRLLLGLGA